jgi:N-acetylglucosaminyldiphosphoundecaprenol N-acetyl-beta-D-mannosaminyltransferase
MEHQLDHSIAVMGLPLANVTNDEAVEAIERLILAGGSHQVATANLDFWVNSLKDVDLHRIIAGCSLVLPDGMPLVWISRLLGKPLKERVSGVDMVPRLAELSARKGYGIYLLGGRPGVAARAKEKLEAIYPGCKIVGHHAPPLADLERMDHGDTLERIRVAKPDILLVAFGNPKQEKWIRMHAKRLGVPVSIGIGGSMDILVGDVQRAPLWMQRIGLEWLGRCLQEPSRLLPRYARNFGGLASHLPLALVASVMQRAYRGASLISRTSDPGMVHLHIQGSLIASSSDALDRAVASCIQDGQLLVAHLEDLEYASAEGLGALLDARQRLLAIGLSLSLAEVPVRMKMLFAAWCIQPLFDEFNLQGTSARRVKSTSRATQFVNMVGKERTVPAKIEG